MSRATSKKRIFKELYLACPFFIPLITMVILSHQPHVGVSAVIIFPLFVLSVFVPFVGMFFSTDVAMSVLILFPLFCIFLSWTERFVRPQSLRVAIYTALLTGWGGLGYASYLML